VKLEAIGFAGVAIVSMSKRTEATSVGSYRPGCTLSAELSKEVVNAENEDAVDPLHFEVEADISGVESPSSIVTLRYLVFR